MSSLKDLIPPTEAAKPLSDAELLGAGGEEKHEFEFVVELHGFAAVFGHQRFPERGDTGAGSVGEAVYHMDAGSRCGME